MKNKFEYGLIEAENFIKRSGASIIKNIGKIIAGITLTVAVLITFTDVSFAGFERESFASGLTLMLICAYLIYFSLEDAGETLGEESEGYKTAREAYEAARRLLDADKAKGLRDFCIEYSREELEYRRENLLMTYGYTVEDYRKYKSGVSFEKRGKRIFRKADALKAVALTPKTLLSSERRSTKSELHNPEKFKLIALFIKLFPSVICMTVTVSVMLTAKDGMTAATVIEGVLKLSTLPIIGFKGYASGYSFVRNALTPWTETKTRLINTFIKERTDGKCRQQE